jgi:hypothetical protein
MAIKKWAAISIIARYNLKRKIILPIPCVLPLNYGGNENG